MGCGSAENPTSLQIYPTTTLYTGVEDTGAKYTVNIAVSGATGVIWSSADNTVATVTGNDSSGTVRAVKEGTTMITATAGQLKQNVLVTIDTYKVSDRMAGQTAWNMFTCAKSGCHDQAGPDVSPSGIAKHDDDELIAAFTMGKNPEGGDLSIGAAAHSFAVMNTTGLVAYLRSLQPKQIPIADE
jgi:hypothetical protein